MADFVQMLINVPRDKLPGLTWDNNKVELVVRTAKKKFEEFLRIPVHMVDPQKQKQAEQLRDAVFQHNAANVDPAKMNRILDQVNKVNRLDCKDLRFMQNDMKDALAQFGDVAAKLKSIKKLSYVNIIVGLVNLSATVYGIVNIKNSLYEVRNKLDRISTDVDQIKNMMTSELQADFHRICLNFGTMTTRIGDGDPVARQDTEELLTEMRVFIQRIMRDFASGAAADIALDMIFSLLSAFTALLCYYARDYYFEKGHLPAHIDSYADIYSVLLDNGFTRSVEDYLLMNRHTGVIQMEEAVSVQKLYILNCMLQYEDQLDLLSAVRTKDEYEALERFVSDHVRTQIYEELSGFEKDDETAACAQAIRAAAECL